MWRGLALREEVVLGPSSGQRHQDRVHDQAWSGDPAPSSNSKAADQGDLQCLKDSASRQREQGPGTVPKPSNPPTIAREWPFGVATVPGAGLQHPLHARPSTDRCWGLRSGGVAGDKDA